MMRVLHISSEFPPQQVFGLGRYVAELAKEQVRLGHEVHVLTNSMGGQDQDVIDSGVAIHRINYPPPPKPTGPVSPVLAFNLFLQDRSLELGKASMGDPNLIVTHDWLTALAGAHISKRFAIPHIWTVHDTVHGKRFGRLERHDVAVFAIERWAMKTADAVIANSKSIKGELTQVYQGDEQKIHVVPCAIDPRWYEEIQENSRLEKYRELFASPDELLITYVGRLDLEKGIDTLINAFAKTKKQCPKIRLAIIGKGELENVIREHITSLALTESVSLYGYLDGEALKHLFLISDIHVCPSLYEPFGIVALEAMAARRPVIASAVGGLCDIIDSPDVGRLVPPANVDELSATMLALIGNPDLRCDLGKKAAQRAKNTFNWTNVAHACNNVYSELGLRK
ncbi:MAG TPA: glycosyltransferase family 4 protein [Candidatus Paceibacterota bacterium]|nr:glycosyltransferase family 4 protein [Candidatus Paceibacterota bacterium]